MESFISFLGRQFCSTLCIYVWPTLKLQLRRSNAFRASCQVSENSELFQKLNPGTQFQHEWISAFVQLFRSLRGSEADPTTSSQHSSFQGRDRSLDPERLRRAIQYSWTNGVLPISLPRPSAFRSDLR